MDCLTHARVCKVACRYFLQGFPDSIFQVFFPSLCCYDSWRVSKSNSNKIVVSTHIMYEYPDEITSPVYKKDSRAENRSLFE